jgi:hypothetical protein
MTSSTSVSLPSWYRGFIQGKTRITLAWVFAAALILLARTYPTLPGIAVCFLGATLRYWASGFLRKDNRPAVGGPYAMTRNPLYFGTFLMGLGVSLAIGNYWLLAIFFVVFTAIYHFIILDEEEKLARIFGAPYLTYKNLVPRFFPRPWPLAKATLLVVNPEESHHSFSREIAKKNKAFEPYWSFLGLIGAVYAIAWAWQNWA